MPKPAAAKKFVAPPQPCWQKNLFIAGQKLMMGMENNGPGPAPPPPDLGDFNSDFSNDFNVLA